MRRMVAVMACLVALAGCNGEGDNPTPSVAPSTVSPTETATPVPTVTPTPTPTVEPTPPPTAAARPWTVDLSGAVDDGEVTIEEAQQIIDAQDALINRALIPFLTSDPKPSVVPRRLARAYLSVYPDDRGDIALGTWRTAIERDFEGINVTDPSGLRRSVKEVRGFNEACISLLVEDDFSGRVLDPFVVDAYVDVERLEESKLDNATMWLMTNDSDDPPGEGFSCLD